MKSDEKSNFETLIINQSKCQDFDKKTNVEYHGN